MWLVEPLCLVPNQAGSRSASLARQQKTFIKKKKQKKPNPSLSDADPKPHNSCSVLESRVTFLPGHNPKRVLLLTKRPVVDSSLSDRVCQKGQIADAAVPACARPVCAALGAPSLGLGGGPLFGEARCSPIHWLNTFTHPMCRVHGNRGEAT